MDDIDRIVESPRLSLGLLAVYPSIFTDAVGYCSSALLLSCCRNWIPVNNTRCPLLRTKMDYSKLQAMCFIKFNLVFMITND
jgi:hypothetical protein